ncbi:hypothetical protein ACIGFL_07045 [Pseudomonas sp. NPDC077649]|uniref:hypothetical protein n=1 Tax=Pseudomonas sp. NPDC077649 TaxID=3364423 RepID=UPI0037C9BAB4
MISRLQKFIAPFLTSHLHKDPVSIHGALKGMPYGQAAIAFTIFINDTSNKSHIMTAFTFIFPIFIVLGAAFGAMAQQENKSGNILVVAIFLFALLTALHSTALFVFFFSFNKLAPLTFFLSVLAIFNIFGFAAKLHKSISASDDITEKL